jgi:hypothetical protein
MMPKKAEANPANSQASRDLIAAAKEGNLSNLKKALAEGGDVTYAVRFV